MDDPDLRAMQLDPELVLESGGGWIGYLLDRIDAVYGHTFIGTRVPLDRKPSDHFRERIWISRDPDERTIPALAVASSATTRASSSPSHAEIPTGPIDRSASAPSG
jgi:hypothetical protein